MRLTPEEEAMLAGQRGEAVCDALRYQLAVGEFFGAERFVPITNAHMMGDIEVMGDGGLGWLKATGAKRARACVPTHDQRAVLRFRARGAPRPGRGRSRQGARADRLLARDGRPHHRHLHQLPDALPAAPRRARRLGRHRDGDLRQLGVRGALELRVGPGRARGGDHRPHAGVRVPPRPPPQGNAGGAARGAARRSRRLGRGRQDRRREAPELLRRAGVHAPSDVPPSPTS